MTREPEVGTAAPAAAERTLPRRSAPRWAETAAGPLLAAVLSLAAAAQALRLWDWRPGIPLSLQSDSPQVLIQVRAILDGGWYAVDRQVGAPFGLNQSWFSTADVLNFSMVRAIGLFTGTASTASAVFFIVGFPLAALTAYWLARQLGLTRPAAVTTGVLFSVLPGHQVWFAHLWLAAYWMVPLAVWLVVQTARGDSLWPSWTALRQRGPLARRARWAALRTGAIVVAVGLADVYYVAFTLILLAAVLVIRLGTGTRAIRLVPGAAVSAGIALLCAASLFVITRGRAGDQVTGALPAQRVIGESETYAGKIIELILPWYQHRVPPLRFLTYAYGVAAQPSVERPALGFVALLGITAIVWRVITSLATGRRIQPLWGLLGALTLVSLAFYTRGGLGSMVALFVTPEIRTWSRFVVLLELFGLLAAGLWLSALGRERGRRAAWIAAALVLVVGVLDQTSPGAAPNYVALSHQQAELTAYTRTLARAVGDCPVFQLPVTAFPEEPPPGVMGDYDHFLPAVAAPAGMTWSYGAIRGTARADWQLALPIRDQKRLLEDVAAAGFCSVEINHDGYAGVTDPSPATERLTGTPVASAPGSHLTAYDLRPLAATLKATLGDAGLRARRDQVLHPVVASVTGSLVDLSRGTPFQWTGPRTTVSVSNLGASPVETTLSMVVTGVGDAPRTITVTAPDSSHTLVTSASAPTTVVLHVRALPGTTRVELTSTGDVVGVPGTEGKTLAALKVSDLRLVTTGATSAASLQQFAAASPRSLR